MDVLLCLSLLPGHSGRSSVPADPGRGFLAGRNPAVKMAREATRAQCPSRSGATDGADFIFDFNQGRPLHCLLACLLLEFTAPPMFSLY